MPALNWIGKDAVVDHHRKVPTRLLECDPKLSFGDPDAENLLVEGDNLEALKALLPRYRGQVKCIYIDPPYNTGNENWIYNDNVNDPRIRKWLGKVVGKDAEDLCRHDKWLCMMYPRLAMLREFLRDDGVILVSIDDNELGLLRLLLDEIFGQSKFVATFVWQKRYSRENRECIGDAHEYILCYAMDKDAFKQTRQLVPIGDKQRKVYKNPDDDPRGPWQSVSMTAQGYRPNQMYKIISPNGNKHLPPEGRCWSTVESEFVKLQDRDAIYWGKNGDGVPRIKRFLSESDGLVPWTWLPHEEGGHTGESAKEIRELLGTQTAFDTPKPVRLITYLLRIATLSDSIVMDSFAGSGTTGHAVLELNKRDSGNRKCVLVELDESIAKTVTSARIEKASAGYRSTKGKEVEGLGSGFRYCRLGRTLLDEYGDINGDVPFPDLARYVFLLETGVPVPKRPRKDCPLLGVHRDSAVYLLFNGVLGDRRPAGGNVLTHKVLGELPPHPDGNELPKVIFGESTLLSDKTLTGLNVTFRQIPYELREA